MAPLQLVFKWGPQRIRFDMHVELWNRKIRSGGKKPDAAEPEATSRRTDQWNGRESRRAAGVARGRGRDGKHEREVVSPRRTRTEAILMSSKPKVRRGV